MTPRLRSLRQLRRGRLLSSRANRAYARLLWLLRGRDPEERRVIRADAERLFDAAGERGRGAVAATWLALTWDLVAGTAQDLGRAIRSVVRAPGFTLTVSVLLGFGVAATTTLFALVNAVILKPLPYDDPEQLVAVWESNVPQNRLREGPSPGSVDDWTVNSGEAFDAVTGWWTAQATLRGRDGSAPVSGVQVTKGFFDVFRRAPQLGRTFTDDEYPGRPSITSGQTGGLEPVLVLSHRLWQSLGGDPALVGGTVHVEGRNWRVLGVMPPDFAVPNLGAAFWTPWDPRAAYRGARFPDGPPRDFRFLSVAGRVRRGLSIEAAAERLSVLAARAAVDHPRTNTDWGIQLVPLRDELVRSSRTELLLVFGAVLGLLLLVCANVASLAIARSAARARELAIRLALGAGRTNIIREHLADTALCAVLTALVAIVLTMGSLGAAVAFAPADIPRLHEVEVNVRIVWFAVAAAVLATSVGVFLPGLRGVSPGIANALKDGAPVSGRHAGRVRRVLVVAEIAVTVVLLVGAGLLARSFASLRRVDPGFDMQNLLVLRIAPDVTRYRGQAVIDYYTRVLDSIGELPGVRSVAAVTVLPMSTIGSDFYRPYWLEGARPAGNAIPQANVRMATPGYFDTLGLRLVAGREFSRQDETTAPRVIIINESLARTAWPGQDPLGRSLVLDYQGGPTARQVVGVVRDARYDGPRSSAAPEIFIPHAQNPYLVMNVVARTTIEPAALAETARAQALKVDADQPVHSVTTMERLLDDTLQQDRFAMLFVALFAAAGLVTAVTGVYALLAYTVAQRRREIAVRMAIGASSSSVARLVVMESLMLGLAGSAIGALGVAAVGRLAQSVLFGIAPQDPLTLAFTAAVLFVAVLAASWLPARRAAKIDPVSAMRI
ncbi:MAG TPA: ABC transporter permease [Vicinamibacterales bacterium]|nr:ABC transporter permease [Vicinamibacterales bacterium]